MSSIRNSEARAVARFADGEVLATVEIAASPARVFRAIASREIVDWWVRPGVFDTTEWTGDVRAGGRWRAAGAANGRPYVVEGSFLEVDAPNNLVHTWEPIGGPATPTTVTYLLEPNDCGTRLTLRQSRFVAPEAGTNFAIGWQTSLDRLVEILSAELVPSPA
jgi:uncharacterized protein YndB with AHSA1/START domain